MDFNRSDQEPDEYDPEAAFEDPDADSVTIPRVEPPEVDVPEVEIPTVDTDESDVPSELRQGFWTVVLITNVAVLFLALAPMLLYFWRSTYHAGVLFLGGLVLLGFAYRRYKLVISMDIETWEDEPATGQEAASSTVDREVTSSTADQDNGPSTPEQ